MVVGDKIPWLPVFRLHARTLALVLVIAAAVALAHRFLDFRPAISPLPFSVVGVALSIFLAFRNNAAYDRYWEGRKLWGGVVNSSRSFGRQVTSLIVAPAAELAELTALRARLVRRQIAWAHALRAALRGDAVDDEQSALLAEPERLASKAAANQPVALMQAHAHDLAAAAARGWLSDHRLVTLDATLTDLTALQGGCERIRKTPIPLAYRFFTATFVRVFCVLLPFALVDQLGLATVAASLAVTFVFIVLDRIGAIVEDPFSNGINGLPLSAICRTIEIDLRSQLGETDLPAALTPTPILGGTAKVLR
jgi:putative membrane protein